MPDQTETDSVYIAERNKCVALIARMAVAQGLEVGLDRHDEADESWDNEWRNIIFIELPSGQVSWHFHDSELPLFNWLAQYEGAWDGHTTEEKYQRVLDARF